MEQTVIETNFEALNLIKRGKVRDIYDIGDHLLMVATDRISAFDVVMPNPIPEKGKILTQISLFWFEIMRPVLANHVISANVDDYPEICRPYSEILRGRSMLVKKAEPLPIECIVRGYISGSGWNDYQVSGSVCGIKLPTGLKESDKLSKPVFTPSTKAASGLHDIKKKKKKTVEKIGKPLAENVRKLSLEIYNKGADLAYKKGIIIADTKFEFGILNDDLILIDEILTPDSSRFWPQSSYKPGGAQNSFDKQYLRDYLLSISWNKKPPAPFLPQHVITNTRNKYIEAFQKLTAATYAL
ncbi:MAG: phosphoribosylaminoimidazolesuccinocarboxamide synthase [Deltaproteobacteria bacterium]|jgi:phosphoribosylaminoimidazole-succinocarboxamide synthase|nr:phosphoribosylaminoimidazolesuccinocarboxamide synthase [Deltaproteobacteria bacterium]